MSPKVWNKRDKNVPKDAVYVGRPSKWGNQWSHLTNTLATHKVATRLEAIEKWANWLKTENDRRWGGLALDIQDALRGKDLVCWCAPTMCHADLLLVIANEPIPEVLTVTDDLKCPKCGEDLSKYAALIGCPQCKTQLSGFGCRKYRC